MDTHIAPHPEPEDRTAPLSARLPEEPLEADEHGGADEPGLAAPSADERLAGPAPTRPKRRQSLLLGVAIVSLGIAGGSAFLLSPYNHMVPVPGMARTVRHLAAAAGVTLPAPLAPSASLAGVDLPPAQNAVIRPKFTPPPPDQQLSELLRLHPGAPDVAPASTLSHQGSGAVAALPGGANGPPPGYVPSEPGSQPVAHTPAPTSVPVPARVAVAQPAASRSAEPGAPHDVTSTVMASLNAETHSAAAGPEPRASSDDDQHPPAPAPALGASQPQATRSPPATPSVAPGPTDALKVAGELRAAPMTPPQQVQVLDLVSQMATMVRDLKTADAQLRADVSRSSTDTTARLADFERRLAWVEARNAVSAANAAGTEPAVAAPSAVPVKVAATPVMLTRAEAILPVTEQGGPKRYRVQAASPGLALLAQDDRGGGDGAQIQVTVGDTLSGYGRVKSIAQHGTTWVVATDRGDIQ
jgi:hypothetical protein